MFWTLIYPSSGACDCVDELPHRLVLSSLGAGALVRLVSGDVRFAGWSRLKLQPAKRTPPNISRNKSSNTQRTENKTTDVVIHQQSRRLLKMDILMSETCWTHNKWNKIASDIKLVFHSSTFLYIYIFECISWTINHLVFSTLEDDTHRPFRNTGHQSSSDGAQSFRRTRNHQLHRCEKVKLKNTLKLKNIKNHVVSSKFLFYGILRHIAPMTNIVSN